MLKLQNVVKIYRTDEVQTRALNGITLEIQGGEYVAIMGPSGCGKSSLLNILGLLDSPQSGEFMFFGESVARHSEQQLTVLRRTAVGFIYQNFNLINDLNVSENVEVGVLYRGAPRKERREKVMHALDRVGLANRAKHMPYQLSGGQQQRVAIARALIAEPRVLLADEPTGNLDTENGAVVLRLLSEANTGGTTVVMVTHSLEHAKCAQRCIQLLDGRVVNDLPSVSGQPDGEVENGRLQAGRIIQHDGMSGVR